MRSCLICDDHAMMREALVGSVGMHWPDAAIATAPDFPSAWTAAAAAPDLILCDLGMPGASPLGGVAGVQRAAPTSPLLVITANEDDAVLLALFDLGIAGFVPKSSTGAIIEAAIRLVLAGGRYLPHRVIELASDRPRTEGVPVPAPNHGIARLTNRQIEVLRRIAHGETNKEIARDFGLSPATVKAHVAAILAALDTTNRTEAAFRAREIGLI
jgi:two-component system, NarL family, nitrate/nitrite response regulator NarL